FNRLIDLISAGTQTTQQGAPSADIGVELNEGVRLLYAVEAMSRANALAVGLAEDELAAIPIEELIYQIGYYHTTINLLAADANSGQREAAAALLASPAWQQVTAAENALLRGEEPPGDVADWQEAAAQLNRALLDMWIGQSDEAELLAKTTADDDARNSLYAGLGLLLVSAAAFLIALALANRIIR